MNRLFSGTPLDIPPRCEDCGEFESECTCTREQKLAAQAKRDEAEKEAERIAARRPPSEQKARVSLEKRKGNRSVTVVYGLTSAANDFPQLLKQLQSTCGTGGTAKEDEDVIELQGNHMTAVQDRLREIGYQVKQT